MKNFAIFGWFCLWYFLTHLKIFDIHFGFTVTIMFEILCLILKCEYWNFDKIQLNAITRIIFYMIWHDYFLFSNYRFTFCRTIPIATQFSSPTLHYFSESMDSNGESRNSSTSFLWQHQGPTPSIFAKYG